MFTVIFLVILILVATFTVIFGQIQCQKNLNVYSLLIQSSLFGHLYSFILASLILFFKIRTLKYQGGLQIKETILLVKIITLK